MVVIHVSSLQDCALLEQRDHGSIIFVSLIRPDRVEPQCWMDKYMNEEMSVYEDSQAELPIFYFKKMGLAVLLKIFLLIFKTFQGLIAFKVKKIIFHCLT